MYRIFPLAFLAGLAAAPPGAALAGERTVTLSVDNMVCAACPVAVRTVLRRVAGVKTAAADFSAKTATVVYDEAQTDPARLAAALTTAGFPARPKE